MENFDPGLIFSSIKSNRVNLNWATSNLSLLEKMRINASKKESSFPSINKLDNSQFIDETCQGKLFERKFAINDNNSQEFQIKAILSELRQNFGTNIPREIIDQLIRRYLHNNFEQFQFIRKEVLKFLMEILEANLPTNAHKRWEWVCIILSDFTEVYSDINFLYTLSNFSKIILKYFKDDKISLEFKQFFLNLLEYDYAFICLNNKNTIKDQQHLFREVLNNKRDVITVNNKNLIKKNLSTINQLPSTPRRIGIGSMHDLNNFPLIYFLLCFIKPDACNFHEHILNKLESIIVQDLLMHFHPKELSLEYCRVYARLIGLILDSLLFIERQGDMHIFNVEEDISKKLKIFVCKIKAQHDIEENNNKKGGLKEKDLEMNKDIGFEWRMFLLMAGVPWIGELPKMLNMRGTYKIFN